MAGLRPQEGDILSGNILLKAVNVNTFPANTDRAANLVLCLFTTAAAATTNTSTYANINTNKVTGNGYADKSLTDGSWTDAGSGLFTYAAQTFTPSGGNWINIRGYAIHTNASGTGSPKLLAIEDDPNQPITVNNGSDYIITPQITFS